jgi:hypothetical protein
MCDEYHEGWFMDSQKMTAVLSMTSHTSDVHLKINTFVKPQIIRLLLITASLAHTSMLTHIVQTKKSFEFYIHFFKNAKKMHVDVRM